MADELYADFSAALSDFRKSEGEPSYKRLLVDLGMAVSAGHIRPLKEIRYARQNHFWNEYDRIVVREDLEGTGIITHRE